MRTRNQARNRSGRIIEACSPKATAKQGEALRKAVGEATLKALQGRELTMENIRRC